MSLRDARDNNVGIYDHMAHRLFLACDSGLYRCSLGLGDDDTTGIRRGLCLASESVDGATGVGLVGVIGVYVVHVEVSVGQYYVLAANVCVGV